MRCGPVPHSDHRTLRSSFRHPKHLATHGPGVYHVAWGVDNIRQVAQDLAAKGNKMRGQDGITTSPRGYLTANIDPGSPHGLRFQLAEG